MMLAMYSSKLRRLILGYDPRSQTSRYCFLQLVALQSAPRHSFSASHCAHMSAIVLKVGSGDAYVEYVLNAPRLCVNIG